MHSTVLDLPPQGVGDGFGGPPLHAEAVVTNDVDQLGDGGRAVDSEMDSEHIAQLDSAQ
jgi:hypothetical protein